MPTSLASRYFTALGKACRQCRIKNFALVHGASEEDLHRLREKFPGVPESLVQLLSQVDGTYYRKYKGKEVRIAVFDDADEDIPYYLNSVEQILEQNGPSIAYIYGDPGLEDNREDPAYLANFMDMVGEGINPFQPFGDMLHFSDCINNGGSSALYIDFHPAKGGKKGQIVRMMHDPDNYTVVAPSFDAFLEAQLATDFAWMEEEEEKPEDPVMTALLAGLKANDPAAEQQLQVPEIRARILGIMGAVPSPAVLRACMQRLEELHAVYDEMAPSGYTYGPQFDYLISQFHLHADVYMQDAALREEVAAFARRVGDIPLIRQLGLEQAPEEAAKLFRQRCNFSFLLEQRNILSPEAFFRESALAWNLPSFHEFLHLIIMGSSFAAHTPGTRKRMFTFDPGWKDRLRTDDPLSTAHFGILADLAQSVEDIEWLKQRYTPPEPAEYTTRLALFCHALCLVGEEQVDAHLPWVFEQVLAARQALTDSFRRHASEHLAFDYIRRDFEKDADSVCGSTLIVTLRPEKSLELLARIDALLVEERSKKACARLVRLLKERSTEASTD